MQTYETSRCLLRAIDLSDATSLLENFSDPKAMAYYDTAPITELIEMERILLGWNRQIVKGERCRWAIVMKDSGKTVGTCGLQGINSPPGRAELGCEVGRAHWSKGIMTEVCPVLLEHAFQVLLLDRVTVRLSPRNLGSMALVRKFGFRNRVLPQVAGWLRDASFRRRIFSLTRADHAQRMRDLGGKLSRNPVSAPLAAAPARLQQ